MLKVGGAEKHYSSLVFVPRAVDENNDGKDDNNGKFHTYDADDGYWFFSNGDTAKATGCTQSDACTFQDAVAGLAAPQEFQNKRPDRVTRVPQMTAGSGMLARKMRWSAG